MEVLSDVLRAIELTGAVFLDVEFRAPWNISARGVMARLLMPHAEHFIHYHYIVDGQCSARIDGGDQVELRAGDVVVFPLGDKHLLGSHPHLAATPLSDVLSAPKPGEVARLQFGGDGDATHIVCGFLACDPHLCEPILSTLPRVFKVSLRESASGDWLESSFRQSVAAAASKRAGADVVLARLSEALFVETLRQYVEALAEGQRGWLAGLRDPLVASALKLLHQRPAHSWTVEELAREVGCSRTVMAERFTDYLGRPPIQYLTKWRLSLAASQLRASTAGINRIAQEVGYESEGAFNRAFKREFGMPPARWRRREEQAEKPTASDLVEPTTGSQNWAR